MDKLDEVNCLLPRFRQLPEAIQQELIKLVAFAGSLAMAKLLIDTESLSNHIRVKIVVQSIKGENIEVLSWAASKFPPWGDYLGLVNRAVMHSNSAEVFEIWEKNLAQDSGYQYFILGHVVSVASDPMQEIRLVAVWKKRASLGRLKIQDLGDALRLVAQNNCSIVLAKALLELGANVNFRKGNRVSAMTPLHHAARKTSAEAAELTKFLLLSGADPAISARIKGKVVDPSMERGARNISKWLGMTWDELVRLAQEERKKSSQNGESTVVEW